MSSTIEASSHGLGEVQVEDNHWSVAPGILRVSYGFPNMFVVRGGEKSALIDTGWGEDEEVDGIRRHVLVSSMPLEAIIITHAHPDHAGGIEPLRELFPDVPVVGLSSEGESTTVIDLGGRALTVFPGSGHTKDSRYVFDSDARALFTGDNILGDLTADVEYMGDYMQGLGALVSLNPNIICPGHYESVYDATPAILAVLRHREERERQVLQNLTTGRQVSLGQLFDKIYGSEFEDKRSMATFQIESHLIKLEKDGKAREGEGGWSLA